MNTIDPRAPRPTPETDAITRFGPTHYEWYEHGRRLERERDEARDQLQAMREAIRETHRFIRNIVTNHECGSIVDAHGESVLAKLQPFIEP